MKIFIAIIILLSKVLCAAACVMSGTSVTANNILPAPIKTSSALNCQISCQNLLACQYFNFKISTKDCTLKFGSATYQTDLDAISGPQYCNQNKTCFYQDGDFWGYDLANRGGLTAIYDCQLLCQNTPNCRLFTINFNTCWLKNGRVLQPSTSVGVVSGLRSCEESNCLDYGRDYTGDISSVPGIDSATLCQFECQKNEACKFFTYKTDNAVCYFKSSSLVSGTPNTVISGPKFCFSKKANVNYVVVKKLPGLLMGWYANMTMGNIVNCAGMCNAKFMDSMKCTAFIYSKTTNLCEMFVVGPLSFQKFLSDETQSNVMHVRENIFG